MNRFAGLGLLVLLLAGVWSGLTWWHRGNPLEEIGQALVDEGASPRSLARACGKLASGAWTVTPVEPPPEAAPKTREFSVGFSPRDAMQPSLDGYVRITPAASVSIGRLVLSPRDGGAAHTAAVGRFAEAVAARLAPGGTVPSRSALLTFLGQSVEDFAPRSWIFPKRFSVGDPLTICTETGSDELRRFGIVFVSMQANDSSSRTQLDALLVDITMQGRTHASEAKGEQQAQEGKPPSLRSERGLERGTGAATIVGQVAVEDPKGSVERISKMKEIASGTASRIRKRRTIEGERWFYFSPQIPGSPVLFKAVLPAESADAESLARVPVADDTEPAAGTLDWSGRVGRLEADTDGTSPVIVLTDFAFEWRAL